MKKLIIVIVILIIIAASFIYGTYDIDFISKGRNEIECLSRLFSETKRR